MRNQLAEALSSPLPEGTIRVDAGVQSVSFDEHGVLRLLTCCARCEIIKKLREAPDACIAETWLDMFSCIRRWAHRLVLLSLTTPAIAPSGA